jgi:hypothetical protein
MRKREYGRTRRVIGRQGRVRQTWLGEGSIETRDLPYWVSRVG